MQVQAHSLTLSAVLPMAIARGHEHCQIKIVTSIFLLSIIEFLCCSFLPVSNHGCKHRQRNSQSTQLLSVVSIMCPSQFSLICQKLKCLHSRRFLPVELQALNKPGVVVLLIRNNQLIGILINAFRNLLAIRVIHLVLSITRNAHGGT